MKLHFTRTNNAIDEEIDRLVGLAGPITHADIVREMIIAALKAGQEGYSRADMRQMNLTLKEMRFTSKVFSRYRGVRKVTVFGSARSVPGDPVYELARQFGERLAKAGYMVITGAGGGIMQAVNEGAGAENSFGVNILLPFEQKPNPVLAGNPRLITYKYFFNRKVAFVKEADAIALFPGGFGTLDEAMEILTLVQTGKHYPVPLILIDEPHGTYWKNFLKFFREELFPRQYISPSDFHLFECVSDVDDAVKKVQGFYRRFHSLRYVDHKLVIRLVSEINEAGLERLRGEFADILESEGTITLVPALPAEMDEPEIADLPRLLVDFDQKSFGRLRLLIDGINQA